MGVAKIREGRTAAETRARRGGEREPSSNLAASVG